jgi:hypothetical protein
VGAQDPIGTFSPLKPDVAGKIPDPFAPSLSEQGVPFCPRKVLWVKRRGRRADEYEDESCQKASR